MRKKKLFIVLIVAVIISVFFNLYRNRDIKTEGFRCGSQDIPDSSLQNYYIFRYDVAKGFNNTKIKKPLYAILWKSQSTSLASSSSWQVVKMINDRKISIAKKEKAIYSLQSDFTLSTLPLKEVEVNSLFDLFLSSKGNEPFYKNSIWQSQIAPNLIIVEVPKK
jgi:hypothetical protein